MTNGQKNILIGAEARRKRKNAIRDQIAVVAGNRGWKKAFITAYPLFDSYEGTNLLALGQQGRADDQILLDSLTEWIPKVIKTKPDWYQKQNHLFINK